MHKYFQLLLFFYLSFALSIKNLKFRDVSCLPTLTCFFISFTHILLISSQLACLSSPFLYTLYICIFFLSVSFTTFFSISSPSHYICIFSFSLFLLHLLTLSLYLHFFFFFISSPSLHPLYICIIFLFT